MDPIAGDPRSRARATFALGLLAILAFLPALRNGFVYDDEDYILHNALIASWSWDHLRAILTGAYFGNFHPLHLLLLALEHSIFGLSPVGWHAVSLGLHALNAMFLFRLLPRFGVPSRIALVGAAIFAVHPVQAETVAWVSEQKSLLSLLFTLLALDSYLTARSSGGALALSGSLAAFVAALASKVSAVALVPLLAAIEWLAPPSLGPRRSRTLARLLPFLVVAGTFANLAIDAHGREGFIHPYPGGSFAATLLTIGPVLVDYAGKLIWPVSLAVAYDLPPATEMALWAVIGAWLLVVAGGIVAMRAAAREPERRIALCLVWIGATLAPVLNLVPIGTLLNDRYLYAPLCAIGPMAAAALLALARVAGRPRENRTAGFAAAGALVVALAVTAGERAVVFRDEEHLWRDAVAKSPRSGLAHYNLGTLWLERGRGDLAEPELRAAMVADPARVRTYWNLGVIHFREGRFGLAVVEFQAAAKLSPGSFDAWMDLASAQAHAGRDREAIEALHTASRLRPDSAAPHVLHGLVLERAGDRAGALLAFRAALALPDRKGGQDRIAEEHIRNLESRIGNRGAAEGGTEIAAPGGKPGRNGAPEG